jgi:hypothetical protein
MGDVDQRLGAFPDGPPDHRGDAVFRYDEIERFSVGELIRKIVHGEQNVGLALQIAAGKGEDRPAPAGVLCAGKEFLGLSGSGGDVALADV